MDEKGLRELSAEVYTMVFQMLDALPEFGGEEAGRIARSAERAFETQARRELNLPVPAYVCRKDSRKK